MDNTRATKLLKKALKQIPHLRTLPPDNQEIKLWYKEVYNIFDLRFGRDRSIGDFRLVVPLNSLVSSDEIYQSDLNNYEIAIKSAIHKCELLDKEASPTTTVGVSPKAFIVHGGKSAALRKLQEFIQGLGIDPLIVEALPTTKGVMSVNEKVKTYMQEADCGVVLATRGGIVDLKILSY